MDPSSLDPTHGLAFSSEVRSSLGRPVCSPTPDLGSSFWLIAAFSRSRLRLSSDSVGFILQSILGSSADLFSVVELEQQLFKFTVLDRKVGLRVYALKSFACDSFKVFFHLWNQNGLASYHTRLSEENQVHNYMHARIKFHAYSDIKVNTETVSRKKKKNYQRFTLNPGNEGSKHHRQSTGGCVRLAPATTSQDFRVASFF
jgi:hypothetical protein